MSDPQPPPYVGDELIQWLRANRGAYTDEALREQMARSGYGQDTIARAFELAGLPESAQTVTGGVPSGWTAQPRPSVPPDPRAFIVGLLLLVGTPFVAPGLVGGNNASIVWAIAFVSVLFGLLGAVLRGRLGIAKGLGYAMLTAILIPLVLLVVLFGICLVAGAPSR